MISHLVLSAGGVNGFRSYGAIRESEKLGLWKREGIETIHCCSSGAILAVMVSLGYEWNWLDDYLIRRPWDSVMAADERMWEAYSSGGIYGLEVIKSILSPLLEAKGHSKDITLTDFCSATGIRLCMIATEIDSPSLSKVEITPETHGDWPLVTAVAGSAAFPLLFKPVRHQGACLLDGGVMSIYPMSECLETGCSPDTVLGFRLEWNQDPPPLAEGASLMQVASALLARTMKSVCSGDHRTPTAGVREITCKGENMSIETLRAAMADSDQRARLIEEGAEAARAAAPFMLPLPSPPPSTETSEQTDGET